MLNVSREGTYVPRNPFVTVRLSLACGGKLPQMGEKKQKWVDKQGNCPTVGKYKPRK